MNQKNGKNSLGLDSCFEEHNNPIDLFKKWFSEAEKNEINDPNAVAVATSDKNNRLLLCLKLVQLYQSLSLVFLNFSNENTLKLFDCLLTLRLLYY